MTSDDELARLLNRAVGRGADEKVSPVAGAFGRGFVAAYDGVRASIRKTTRDAEATPGFDVPSWMSLAEGDHVWFYELGSDRVVVSPLDRNAVVGGGDGTTVTGAPTTADYLVGTTNGTLTNEIVVGTTPGGELGGTWAAPTVDATHSGSSHAGLSGQPSSTDVAILDGGTGASTASGARANLGLIIGTDVRAQGSGDPTRATLGLDTTDSPQFTAVNIGAATDTTVTRVSAGVIAVEGANVLLNGGALGTPSSGTLTNATGLPVSGITASTVTALGVGSVELGHASDTTLSRSSAGVLAVEGVTVPLNSTSSVHTASTIELGAATDTTLSRASAGVLAVEGVNVLLNGGALGTPASGTLTNATGLPVSGITASTVTALGVGTVELGHASDTTLSRASAGVLAVEGVNVLLSGGALGTPSSGTLTNATGLPVAGITASTSTALGVGSIELGNASDTTITRVSGGIAAVEGKNIYLAGGTDVAVADGGTGSSTAAGAATNLGLGTGDSPQFTAVNIGAATDTTVTRVSAGVIAVEGATISVVGHGVADHADVTRHVNLMVNDASVDGGTRTTLGTAPNIIDVIALADAATQGCYWSFKIPDDWTSGTLSVRPVWVPGSTDGASHTVAWSMNTRALSGNSNVTGAGTTVAYTGASGARTTPTLVLTDEAFTDTTVTPTSSDQIVRFNLRRVGADVADTYVGVVNLVAVVVAYTANQ